MLRLACRLVKLECILRATHSNCKPDSKKRSAAGFEIPSSKIPLYAQIMYNHDHAEGELEADPSLSSVRLRQQCRKEAENIDTPVLGLTGYRSRQRTSVTCVKNVGVQRIWKIGRYGTVISRDIRM